jgi:two-component system chemotaxis response regulator CheY
MTTLEGLKVLLVDDEPFIRSTIRAVLRAIDRFEVKEADDGDTALDLVQAFKPDIVLCDIAMPRMGGLQFVQRLRKLPAGDVRLIPVVVLTGFADETIVHDAIRLQISGFLVKPISPKSLGASLRAIFAHRI